MIEQLKKEALALAGEMSAWRREFHRWAEPGWLEMRTTSRLARELRDMGWELTLGSAVCSSEARMGLPGGEKLAAHYRWAEENGADSEFLPHTAGGFTGLVATLRCGEGPTVALRFDMDALGVAESGDGSHRPAAEGFRSIVDGAAHACGHDGHMAMGLGTAKLLAAHRQELHGTVKLLFQPAEEGVRGARSMVEAGHLKDVDFVLGGHIFPPDRAPGAEVAVLAEGGRGAIATTKLDFLFTGRAVHAAIAPQEGHNALLAAATAALNLHAIPRFGGIPTHINVGRFTAGTGRNVVPDRAVLETEVRGATSEANTYMEERAIAIARSAAEMHGCEVEAVHMGGAPAMESSWPLAHRVEMAASAMGYAARAVPVLDGGSEDFSYMAREVIAHGGEATFFSLLTPCAAVNHNDRFDFDESVLPQGAAIFAAVTAELLSMKK